MNNHLFIGLGGQGGRVLGELRKVMEQRARDVEALTKTNVRCAFLAIDSSDDVRNERGTWSLFGKHLELPPSDWLILDRPAAIGDLASRPDINPWIGDSALIDGFLGGGTIKGANQRRRFGRLLFAKNAKAIRVALTGKVGSLTNGAQNQCAFHLFATLGGGTGSGGLIDLITLIRVCYPDSDTSHFPVFVYVFITDAAPQGVDVGYFYQNQFTGLRDLNALICGRLRPQLLGDDIPCERFSGAEPVTQVTLTAPLNSANLQMPLETQLRVVAEACFERIVAWCTGQMVATAQKMLTGEDILPSFPGEPLARPERCYRFSAFGMRRWEVPTEKLKTLLALDLLISGLRQMLFNHWQGTSGYVDQLPDGASTATAEVVADLLSKTDGPRHPAPNAEELTQRLRTALDERATGLAHAPDAAPPSLRDIERAFEEYYLKQFEQGGVDVLVRRRQSDQGGWLSEAVRLLEATLTQLWLDPGQALALARIPQYLGELGAQLNSDGNLPAGDHKGGERVRHVIEKRRLEWDKLTWLSARFTGRRKALIAAQANDCGVMHVADLRRRLTELDRGFVGQLAGRLPQVQSRFQSVQSKLMRLLDTVKAERNQIDQELRALALNVSGNRYEFDPTSLDIFLTWMRRHAHHQQTAAALMRAEIMTAIGGQQPLAAMSDDALPTIEDRLRGLARQQAEQIHLDFKANCQGQPILEDSVLDILERRHVDHQQGFSAEVGAFLNQAAVCLRLRDDTQPTQVLGQGIAIPSMPRRVLLLGLPQHAFTATLESTFRAAIPAGQGYLVEVFKHDDPGQIRLLTVDYWFAARFASVVKSLRDKYQGAATGTGNADTRYFCNIDPDGEQDRRPDLFLPDANTKRLRYEAELWLGQHRDVGVVQGDQNGVSLILEGKFGPETILLGADLAAASKNPDDTRMDALHMRLTEVLAGAGRDRRWLTDLLRQRNAEIQQEYGLNSPQYREWQGKLQLLESLVD